jgi:hypothetical protein
MSDCQDVYIEILPLKLQQVFSSNTVKFVRATSNTKAGQGYIVVVRKFVHYHGESFEMWEGRETKYVHFKMAVLL